MLLLIEALKSDSVATHLWAARALGRIGPPAQATVPLLGGVLKTRDRALKTVAVTTLYQINCRMTEKPGADS
jgi:hypothetical protein